MKGTRGVLTMALVLYFAAAAQQSLARWTVLGGRIDYLLLALSGLCLFANRAAGAAIGFLDGWVYACLVGANMWQYVLVRTLCGAAISWVAESGVERNVFSALIASIFCVLAAQIGLMFLAPPPVLAPFLGDTIRTAVYNGVLATLFYAVLNRMLSPRR